LLVGPAPKIATYSGRGPLRAWLRVVARRIVLEIVDRDMPIADDWEVAALPVAADDPELAYVKARYRAEYERAFAAALGAVGDRERTILAQYHVDGLTIDQLGALYGVHRVTASRWVLRAQEELRRGVLAQLDTRLGLSATELRSLTRLVRSQLTVALAR
jgi:RNA polymerase sigma-70 factor (ECF subfamily)